MHEKGEQAPHLLVPSQFSAGWTISCFMRRDHPQEKEMQKAKWLSEEDLQIAEKRREAKGKGEKIYAFEYRVPKNSKER